MAGTIRSELFRDKNQEDFTACLADPESRLNVGGSTALCAAMAASLLARAAALTEKAGTESERLAYIVRNAEILRKYMVHLIDEDVRCRLPLRKAIQGGDPQQIDAAKQSAVCICSEIVNMAGKCLELLEELAAFCAQDAAHYLVESAELSMASVRASMQYILNMSSSSKDETYRYVMRREQEITLGQLTPVYEKILNQLGK